ncbi:uncharacterized protein LOC105846770 isoform X1 [Hydra vulgaris]|uniref:uncharacterized protein LOC105846770 isoform X1 n=1 Tax=Hydra vulgaris TaxID=6087 RepID=UPI000640E138|nr:uncharacterized protein LOC105846770 [Hydra vulgaris]XP_047143623.1 uncharacterized protein LOC105846770 [Hydra vulgaris]
MEDLIEDRGPIDLFIWREKRQRLFIYWCITHYIHGMVHSIRYSSQYLYFKDVMRASNPDLLYGMSVSFIGITGVLFPLLISPYLDQTRNIRQAIFVVNILGFVGNLLYALPFSPALPLIGQLLAGTTPAFGVIAMGEISRCYSPSKLTKKVSALSLIYSVGTFTSIGLVFSFLYVDFNLGEWHINFANMPGIMMCILFIISGLLAPLLVSDISKEFDYKLEQRMRRSSYVSLSSSTVQSPERSGKNLPHIISINEKLNKCAKSSSKKSFEEPCASFENDETFYVIDQKNATKLDDINEIKVNQPFNFPKFVSTSQEKIDTPEVDSVRDRLNSTVKKSAKSVWKILRYRPTVLLMLITFIEAFVYCIIVTCLPVLATNYLKWGKVELAFLSMVNKFLSVLVSGSVFFLADHLNDFLLLVYGAFLTMLALLILSVLDLVSTDSNVTTGFLFLITCLSISGVPLIITSTRSMFAKLVPTEIQSLTEAVRLSVFEAAFVPAGFLVPIVTLNIPLTSIFLIVVTLIVVIYIILERNVLIDIKEQDDYWLEETERTYSPEGMNKSPWQN